MVKYNKLTLIDEPLSSLNAKKNFICDCGKISSLWLRNVKSGHTKSCGRCNEIVVEPNEKYGKLSPLVRIVMRSGSGKKHAWKCECGNIKDFISYNIIQGKTKSCGICNEINVTPDEKFGRLRIKISGTFKPSSTKKPLWICDCGNEAQKIFNNVYLGRTKSCGACNLIKKETLQNTKFGKLKVVNPISIHKGSDKTILFKCDCGNTKAIQAKIVFSGDAKSCGTCNKLSAEYLSKYKFGKLKSKNPVSISSGSNKKLEWVCDCGQETTVSMFKVWNGQKSCGDCFSVIRTKYNEYKSRLLSISYPISPSNELVSWFNPKEQIVSGGQKFKSECPICGNEHRPRFSDIKRGMGMTCGCVQNKISAPQKEIEEFINSLGVYSKSEHAINKLSYDIFLPDINLVLEFQGLKWHSLSESRTKDVRKYRNATLSGYQYMSIFEDEWNAKTNIVKNILKQRLGKSEDFTSIRPQKTNIQRIPSAKADEFYNSHHYIGGCKSSINYGVFYENQLIAGCSFKKPTRQSKYQWELVRMASDQIHKVHGIWSVIINKFIDEHKPGSIVSFSDNRLFTGSVYGKIGFKLDGEIPPDYYWAKGPKRYHKSGLRKKPGELGTEKSLRESDGYSKIWDVGKKRWVMILKAT